MLSLIHELFQRSGVRAPEDEVIRRSNLWVPALRHSDKFGCAPMRMVHLHCKRPKRTGQETSIAKNVPKKGRERAVWGEQNHVSTQSWEYRR
jgi:hypothetical protein